MIQQHNTYSRILDLIKDGAELRIQYGSDFEGCVYLLNSWIVRDGWRLKIDDSLAQSVVKHPDIREGYAGYRGDYARKWELMYEHKSASVPLWVSEQLGWGE